MSTFYDFSCKHVQLSALAARVTDTRLLWFLEWSMGRCKWRNLSTKFIVYAFGTRKMDDGEAMQLVRAMSSNQITHFHFATTTCCMASYYS